MSSRLMMTATGAGLGATMVAGASSGYTGFSSVPPVTFGTFTGTVYGGRTVLDLFNEAGFLGFAIEITGARPAASTVLTIKDLANATVYQFTIPSAAWVEGTPGQVYWLAGGQYPFTNGQTYRVTLI